ncbi:MAG: hypothetical protein O3B95_12230 [Chloroflexi bacterium]|nr:hypothetical protein [Chloroflexota bacterium]
MFKKITSAVTISALAALSLASIAGASTGDSFDITGVDYTYRVAAVTYANFDIANSDENEEGSVGQSRVQAALFVGNPSQPLNVGAGDDGDKPSAVQGDYSNFTIANGDSNEEGTTGQVKVQFAVTVGSNPMKLHIGAGDDNDKPAGSGEKVLLNIGPSDPREQ